MGGPAFDISKFYRGFDDAKFLADFRDLRLDIIELRKLSKNISAGVLDRISTNNPAPGDLEELQTLAIKYQQVYTCHRKLQCYTRWQLYVDQKNEEAAAWDKKLDRSQLNLDWNAQVLFQALPYLSKDHYEKFLEPEELGRDRVYFDQKRNRPGINFPLATEQKLLRLYHEQVTIPGKHTLNDIRRSIKIEIDEGGTTKRIGLNAAFRILQESPDADFRKKVYMLIEKAVESKLAELAEILVGMARNRANTEIRRDPDAEPGLSVLNTTCHLNGIQASTLNTAMTAIKRNLHKIQPVAKLMAEALGQEKLHPWNLQAPAPLFHDTELKPAMPFSQALEEARQVFGEIDVTWAEFVVYMEQNGWIDALTRPDKTDVSNTSFGPQQEAIRIVLNYTGGLRSRKSLNHEDGHAIAIFLWSKMYPFLTLDNVGMVSHEINSNFAETTWRHHLHNSSSSQPNEQASFEAHFTEIAQILRMLMHLPSDFEFERTLHEQLSQGKEFDVEKLRAHMRENRREYFNDTLEGSDDLAWASRLHFYLYKPEWSFYNWPYTLSFIIGRVLFAKKEEMGEEFFPIYSEFLKDLPKLGLEKGLNTYFKFDITKDEFWDNAIDICLRPVALFETLLAKVKPQLMV